MANATPSECPHCKAASIRTQGENRVFKGTASHVTTGAEYACGFRIKNGQPSQPCRETGKLLLPKREAEIIKRDKLEKVKHGGAE